MSKILKMSYAKEKLGVGEEVGEEGGRNNFSGEKVVELLFTAAPGSLLLTV